MNSKEFDAKEFNMKELEEAGEVLWCILRRQYPWEALALGDWWAQGAGTVDL